MGSAKQVAKDITGPLADARPRRRSPKGRLIALMQLAMPGFRHSLREALSRLGSELADLGIASEKDLLEVLIEAHRRLEGGKNKITASAWVGMAFEVLGARHPDVRRAEGTAVDKLRRLVNEQVATRGGTALDYLNGYLEPAGVRKPFNRVEEVHGVWIRRPGQPKGAQFVDRALLCHNDDGQMLLVSTEFKTRGAAGGLRSQIASRDARLLDARHPEGTKMDYTPAGSLKARSTDLENVILIGPNSPIVLRRASLRTKLGVRAGERYRLTVATDAADEAYIRIIVPIRTDALRRTIERVLRDKSWQR